MRPILKFCMVTRQMILDYFDEGNVKYNFLQ